MNNSTVPHGEATTKPIAPLKRDSSDAIIEQFKLLEELSPEKLKHELALQSGKASLVISRHDEKLRNHQELKGLLPKPCEESLDLVVTPTKSQRKG